MLEADIPVCDEIVKDAHQSASFFTFYLLGNINVLH